MLPRVRYRWGCVITAIYAYSAAVFLHFLHSGKSVLDIHPASLSFSVVALVSASYLLYTASVPWSEAIDPRHNDFDQSIVVQSVKHHIADAQQQYWNNRHEEQHQE